MNITKRGTVPPPEWHGVCRSCKTEATATEPELLIDSLFHGMPLYGYAECPVCHDRNMRFVNQTVATSKEFTTYWQMIGS